MKDNIPAMEQEKKRVVIYTRCTKASEECFKMQTEQLLEFCKLCGFTVLKVINDVGTGICKKRFTKMKRSILKLKPEIVLVTKYEVLTKEYNQRIELFNVLNKNGIELKVLNLPEEYKHPDKAKALFVNLEKLRTALKELNQSKKVVNENTSPRYVVLYTKSATSEDSSLISLRNQEHQLLNYCENSGLVPLKIFRESPIHGTPENVYRDMVDFIKSSEGRIESVFFTKWDRFARNLEQALRKILELKEMGISVNAVEQALDLTNPDNKAMLALYLVMPEIELDKRSSRIRDGIRVAKQRGYWVTKPPFGYSIKKLNYKRRTIKPNSKSSLVVGAYKMVAAGTGTLESIRLQMRKKGLKLKRSAFLNMLRNHAYLGKIRISNQDGSSQELVRGLHNPILSERLFLKVQRALEKRNIKKKKVIQYTRTIKK